MAEAMASGRLRRGPRSSTRHRVGARTGAPAALGRRGPPALGHHRGPGRHRRRGRLVRRRRPGHLQPAGRSPRRGDRRAAPLGDRQPGLAAARPPRPRRAPLLLLPDVAPATRIDDPAVPVETEAEPWPRPLRRREPCSAGEVFLAGAGMERYHRPDCALAAGRTGWTTATTPKSTKRRVAARAGCAGREQLDLLAPPARHRRARRRCHARR